MSTPTITPFLLEPFRSAKRQLYLVGIVSALAIASLLVWPRLLSGLLSTEFLPHLYCYLKNPALVWTHVVADSLIAIAYFSISITLGYLVYKGWHDLPFQGLLTAFGIFILACGCTHLMEAITVWVPVYVLTAAVKILTATASVITAIVLPFTVPQTLALVQQAKISGQVTAELRASEERKDALLQEVHHRVKNNLAVICSLFYLQSTHSKDEESVQVFRDMERRVHSMALVHESLYGSESAGSIDFAEYARALVKDVLSSHGSPSVPVQLKTRLDPLMMSVDLAVLCGLILNELILNALKHGFPNGIGGQIKVTLHSGPEGKCKLCVEDSGVGVPSELDTHAGKSMGLRLVRSLTRQIRGSFELIKIDRGTLACLQFTVDHHGR
jgi:two-component sensor histidine kinase